MGVGYLWLFLSELATQFDKTTETWMPSERK